MLLTQHPNLLSQILDHLLLISIEPAGKGNHYEKNGIHGFRECSIRPSSSRRSGNLLDVQVPHPQRIAQSNRLLTHYGIEEERLRNLSTRIWGRSPSTIWHPPCDNAPSKRNPVRPHHFGRTSTGSVEAPSRKRRTTSEGAFANLCSRDKSKKIGNGHLRGRSCYSYLINC